MRNTKDRVVAIDYFRGLCIIAVVLNHAALFSMPYAYLGGASLLWTSAAEMFLLLSGLTLGIVRGEKIVKDFKNTAVKMWRRAAGIYVLNLVIVTISLLMALFFTSHGMTNNVLGALPSNQGFSLLWSMLNLSYSVGWASFLALYAVFMLFAPFVLYSLRTKYWFAIPIASLTIFVFNFATPMAFGYAGNFALWQFYFILGLVLSRFRVAIISWFYGLRSSATGILTKTIYITAAAFLALNILLNFNISPYVARLADAGWLPVKLQTAYIALLEHRTVLDLSFMHSRTGVLRPLVTLLFLAVAYLYYQKHNDFLLNKTGRYINKMGSETLWIFVAQALTIPLIAAFAVPRNFIMNSILTAALILLMWQVTKRRQMVTFMRSYIAELKLSYRQAKYSYLQRYEDV